MIEPVTAAQMRAIEQTAFDKGIATTDDLIMRSAAAVVGAIFDDWPVLAASQHTAVILCGSGRKGAIGLRMGHLLRRRGLDVRITSTDSTWDLGEDVQSPTLMPYEIASVTHALERPGHVLVVDAMLDAEPPGKSDEPLRVFNAAWDRIANYSPDNDIHCVSIDVPAGYDGDTGDLTARCPFEPDLTVALHRERPVHPIIRNHGYRVVTKDIGL